MYGKDAWYILAKLASVIYTADLSQNYNLGLLWFYALALPQKAEVSDLLNIVWFNICKLLLWGL